MRRARSGVHLRPNPNATVRGSGSS
jgi:hypothetical protein